MLATLFPNKPSPWFEPRTFAAVIVIDFLVGTVDEAVLVIKEAGDDCLKQDVRC